MTLQNRIARLILEMKTEFAADDFHYLIKEMGVCENAPSRVLRVLSDKGFIELIGTRKPINKTKYRLLNVYQIKAGNTYEIKERQFLGRKMIDKCDDDSKLHPNDHWWKKQMCRPDMIAANRLDAAMRGWV